MERIKSFNRYCGKESIPVRLSLLKEFNYEYMEKIIETVESIMNKQKIREADGKGHKGFMRRFRDGFVEDAQRRSLNMRCTMPSRMGEQLFKDGPQRYLHAYEI